MVRLGDRLVMGIVPPPCQRCPVDRYAGTPARQARRQSVKGEVRGLAARTEKEVNNGVTGTSLIPMFVLGIPVCIRRRCSRRPHDPWSAARPRCSAIPESFFTVIWGFILAISSWAGSLP